MQYFKSGKHTNVKNDLCKNNGQHSVDVHLGLSVNSPEQHRLAYFTLQECMNQN